MPSVTTEVQMAVKSIPLGALFTARDIAELLEVNSGSVGQILSRGVRGARLCDKMETRYEYPDQRAIRRVKVYKKVSNNE